MAEESLAKSEIRIYREISALFGLLSRILDKLKEIFRIFDHSIFSQQGENNMFCEISLDSTDLDELEYSYGLYEDNQFTNSELLSAAIFSTVNSLSLNQRIVQSGNEKTEVENKIRKIAQHCKVAPLDTKIGGKAEITVEWGGKDGPSVSGSVSGSFSDDKGNKVEVKVEVDDQGMGKATASAEHDKESDFQK